MKYLSKIAMGVPLEWMINLPGLRLKWYIWGKTPSGPIVWNTTLPKELKECSSLVEFKHSITSWIPNNCPCRLCKPYLRGVGFIETID